MINKLYQKLQNTISIDYTGKQIIDLFYFINDNNFKFNIIEDYDNNNRDEIKYNRKTKKINIPKNVSVSKENKEIFEEAKIYYGNNTLNIIVSHEIGHFIQHSFLIKKEKNINNSWNIGEYGDICLSKINKSNLNIESAQNFLKVNNNKPTGIERFIQRNFVESYADCYSGLITYLMTEDKNVFDKIKNYRKDFKNKIKTKKDVWIKYNQILNGKFATTEYSNIYGIEKFKDNFINKFSKEGIFKLAKNNFEIIHHIIQAEILDGIYKTIKEEAKINDLFLFELKGFCDKRHGLTINEFLNEFSKYVNNVREVYCVYNPTNTLDNGAPFFDYDKTYLNISKDKIIQEYKESLNSKDLISFEKHNIKDLKLNQFTDNYGTSNYYLPVKLTDKRIINKNILNLRNKFIEENNNNKINLK